MRCCREPTDVVLQASRPGAGGALVRPGLRPRYQHERSLRPSIAWCSRPRSVATTSGGSRMTTKFDRQGAILRLVQEQQLSTQEELAEALRREGLDAGQATISRDI